MKVKKVFRKATVVLLSMIMILSMAVPVFATETETTVGNEAVSEARKGVMTLNVYYVTKEGEQYWLGMGSCFLANNKTIVTCEHVIIDTVGDFTEKQRKEYEDLYGLPFSSAPQTLDGHFSYKVAVKRDVEIEATVLQSSKEMDFAILTLANEIGGTTVLPLANSDNVKTTDNVYALGFPGDAEVGRTVNYYTYEDVTVTAGIVSFTGDINVSGASVPCIQHDAIISSGSSGGPLLNAKGEIVGVNDGAYKQYYYSIQINEITDILDAFGISYTAASGSSDQKEDTKENDDAKEADQNSDEEAIEEETPTPTPEQVDLSAEQDALATAISEAKALDTSKFTDESVELLKQALENAEDISAKDDATKAELVTAASDLKSAVNGMEEKSGFNFIWLIVGLVVLILIIVIVILIISNNNNKKRRQMSTPQRTIPPVSPINGMGTMGGTDAHRSATPQSSFPNVGETSVLDAGAGETTLLNSNQSNAALIRKKTGEKIAIQGNNFSIGKERSKVNYCITDNTSISRKHATVIRKGADYYVVDQGSTNFTFVNGNKIMAGQEVKLKSGDSIKFSDETFEFKTN